jgi:hypothetical protein
VIDPAQTIALADSVTALDARHEGAVVVTGSHGGQIAARYMAAAGVRAAIFNDAGVGLDAAGIAGLVTLEALGIAAAAVSHLTARIGDADDAFRHGIIAHANALARALHVSAGDRCPIAAQRLSAASLAPRIPRPSLQGRHILIKAAAGKPRVTGLDSIGLVEATDAGAILVIGSHGGLHGGDPASALPVDAVAAIFHDAGRGKDAAGVSRLPVLAHRGIPAGAVDFQTARIGDARSLWETGVLSCVNASLAALGVREGMAVKDAVARSGGPRQIT